MTDHLALLAALVGPCPDCGHGRLSPVRDAHLVNLVCPACDACWHAEHGFVRRVDPATCTGCDRREACTPGLVAAGG